jgi:hypothetical protein
MLGSFVDTGVRFDRVLGNCGLTVTNMTEGRIEAEMRVEEGVQNSYG